MLMASREAKMEIPANKAMQTDAALPRR